MRAERWLSMKPSLRKDGTAPGEAEAAAAGEGARSTAAGATNQGKIRKPPASRSKRPRCPARPLCLCANRQLVLDEPCTTALLRFSVGERGFQEWSVLWNGPGLPMWYGVKARLWPR